MKSEHIRKETVIFVTSFDKHAVMQVMDMRYAFYCIMTPDLHAKLSFNSGMILRAREFVVNTDDVSFKFLCTTFDSDIIDIIKTELLLGAHVTLVFDVDSVGIRKAYHIFENVRRMASLQVSSLLSSAKKWKSSDVTLVETLWHFDSLILSEPRVFFADGIVMDETLACKLYDGLPPYLRRNETSAFSQIIRSMLISPNAAIRYYGDVLYHVYYKLC